MFSPFFCGSFHHQLEEDDELPCSPNSPTRRSRKAARDSKNPYSNRGLDKFSALLADLEDKKQKIYTEMGAQDISFVRFVYSSSNDCKPIVVKMRDSKKPDRINVEDTKDKPMTQDSEATDQYCAIENEVQGPTAYQGTKKKRLTWKNLKLENWRRPSYYLPVIILLILLCLAMFGRSFAILCTSIGWYLVPTIKMGSSNPKRPRKKKEYVRKLSENKIRNDGLSSPRSVISDFSPRDHGHRKSW
ncbi:uncharacterized protein LOC132274023 [Cornus florida]|uniref:uncharacterized protein LOC132274023 n=1 Tax=Cornus florida TaxID=4283 RepID=UPI00289639D7|nr:uncharacterized protein LOC132274023 [Cornus florida]